MNRFSWKMAGCAGLVAAQVACSSSPLEVVKDGLDSGKTLESGKAADARGAPTADAADAQEARTADAAGSCTSSAECGAHGVCGFPESEGCSARGQCFVVADQCAIPALPGCGCDGTEVNMTSCNAGLPNDYALSPLAHAGVCVPDGGVSCQYEGTTYVPGTMFVEIGQCASCECNHLCTCETDGGVLCAPGGLCGGTDSGAQVDVSCQYGGKTYAPGTNFIYQRPCSSCECTEPCTCGTDGSVFCDPEGVCARSDSGTPTEAGVAVLTCPAGDTLQPSGIGNGDYCSGLCASGYPCHCEDGTGNVLSCPLGGPLACASLCATHGGVAPDAGQ